MVVVAAGPVAVTVNKLPVSAKAAGCSAAKTSAALSLIRFCFIIHSFVFMKINVLSGTYC